MSKVIIIFWKEEASFEMIIVGKRVGDYISNGKFPNICYITELKDIFVASEVPFFELAEQFNLYIGNAVRLILIIERVKSGIFCIRQFNQVLILFNKILILG